MLSKTVACLDSFGEVFVGNGGRYRLSHHEHQAAPLPTHIPTPPPTTSAPTPPPSGGDTLCRYSSGQIPHTPVDRDGARRDQPGRLAVDGVSWLLLLSQGTLVFSNDDSIRNARVHARRFW